MPRNGSGQYNLPYDWNDDKANGIKVLASRMQAQDEDIGTALTGSVAADGQTPLTGDLDFNNNKAVDLADGANLGDAINVSQAQTGEAQFYGVSTTTPAGTDGEDYDVAAFATISAYPTYVRFSFVCHFTCIINPNLRINALATKILKKSNGAGSYSALAAGDMVADKEYIAVYNEDISTTDIIIENPETVSAQSNDLIENLAVATSVSSNALTIAIKTAIGSDPTSNNPVSIAFRSSTATSGSYNVRDITAATSLVISSGSTLGTQNGSASNLYVYALDNSGTIELAISSSMYPDNSIQSTTAEGGVGAADSATVLYSTTARSNVPVRLIGIINITETTAGTWSLNATTVTSAPIGYIASSQSVFLISTATASSSSTISFTGLNSIFSKYIIECIDIIPATNATYLSMRYSVDNGSSYISTNYITQVTYSNATNALAGATATDRINITPATGGWGLSNGAVKQFEGTIEIWNPSSSTTNKKTSWKGTYINTGDTSNTQVSGAGIYTGAQTAVNAIQFFMSSGNIASGTFKLYGIK